MIFFAILCLCHLSNNCVVSFNSHTSQVKVWSFTNDFLSWVCNQNLQTILIHLVYDSDQVTLQYTVYCELLSFFVLHLWISVSLQQSEISIFYDSHHWTLHCHSQSNYISTYVKQLHYHAFKFFCHHCLCTFLWCHYFKTANFSVLMCLTLST